MADETSTTTPPAESATTAPAAETPKAMTAEEASRLQAENATLRKENADRRVKTREADEAKAAAEKAKATEEGRWADVIKANEATAEELRKQVAELGGKATKAEKLEAIIAAEVASLEATVGEERAKSLAHLTPEDRLPILKQFALLSAAGKAPGPKVAAGSPAGATVAVSMEGLSKEQILEKFTPEEINRAAAARSGATRKSPYGL